MHFPSSLTGAAAPAVGIMSSDEDRMFVPRRPSASGLADLSSTGPAGEGGGDSDSGVDSGPGKSRKFSNMENSLLNSLVGEPLFNSRAIYYRK